MNWKIAVVVILILGIGSVWVNRIDEHPLPPTTTKTFDIQTWNTGNGAKVMFVPATQLPMVDIRVVFDAGSARDGKRPGLAQLTAGMLNQGAGDWNTDELAERFDSIGANYGVSVARDMAAFSLRSLTEEKILNQAVTTFATILRSPSFPHDAFTRLRKNTLIAIKDKQQSPGDIAEDLFYQALYGKHPYASPVDGTADSIKAMHLEDLRKFYHRYMVGNNTLVAIVGKMSRKQAEALAERVVGQLPAGEHAPVVPEVEQLKQARVIHRSHPSTQTHILVGQPGLRRGDRDYFPLYVGNHILGGSGFGSRIVKTIREKRGLAYSSYSYFMPMRVRGPFIMGLQTSNDQAKQALDLLREVLVKYIDHGPTEEELDHAKKNITGGFPLRIDSNKDIVGYIAMIGFYDLPLDYLQTFNDKVEAVTAAQIRDAFQRRIHPDKLVTVTVGNGKLAD